MGTKSIKHLKAEHERIHLAVDVLRNIAELAETSGLVREDVSRLLDFLQTFSHEYHDAKEHELLFPALTAGSSPPPSTALERIESDHEQSAKALRDLREALAKGNDADFVEAATIYIDLVTAHIFTEDHLLFQGIEKRITPEVDERLLSSFESFRPQLREDSRIRFDNILYGLRRKYALPQVA